MIREHAEQSIPAARLVLLGPGDVEDLVLAAHREILAKERDAYNERRKANVFKPLIAARLESRIRDYTSHKIRKLLQ